MSPKLVKRHLGASKFVELNQEVYKGKEIAYFVNIYPEWSYSFIGESHDSIDKIASSWTLHG